ncbi:MAG: NADPH-dependent FMN reductase, partial [Deltaproteobacteria bacterium]|nr:NADPH-dependent FMN reductase [Deltaproteobacteria bacterium]
DKDRDFHEEVRNAARSLVQTVKLMRQDKLKQPDAVLRDPRQK